MWYFINCDIWNKWYFNIVIFLHVIFYRDVLSWRPNPNITSKYSWCRENFSHTFQRQRCPNFIRFQDIMSTWDAYLHILVSHTRPSPLDIARLLEGSVEIQCTYKYPDHWNRLSRYRVIAFFSKLTRCRCMKNFDLAVKGNDEIFCTLKTCLHNPVLCAFVAINYYRSYQTFNQPQIIPRGFYWY